MPATLLDERVNLLGLEDIQDGGRGGISVRETSTSTIASIKTPFQPGDILYGKLRPYLNKVGIAPVGGICSTEIWAFTAEPFIDSYFAYAFLSSTFFVQRVSSLTKGANLPRLDIETFESVEIPVPPLSEQRRIVEILRKAGDVRRLRASAAGKAAAIVPSIFRRLFGTLAMSLKHPLKELLSEPPNYGTMTPATEDSRGLLCLRVGNIQAGRDRAVRAVEQTLSDSVALPETVSIERQPTGAACAELNLFRLASNSFGSPPCSFPLT